MSRPFPLSERLRIGDCTVDVPLREIHAPGSRAPRRITPKSMAVLLDLVANAGKVVSRDALLARVWPDTLPSDDVVTQAVTQLRRAFGEVRGDTRYIETIAKGGYRLVATVKPLEPLESLEPLAALAPPELPRRSDPEAAATPQLDSGMADSPQPDTGRDPGGPAVAGSPGPIPSASARQGAVLRGGWTAVLGALVATALLVAALLFWYSRSTRPSAPSTDGASVATMVPARYKLRPRLITSAPGFELAPTLSPDAAFVAYMAVPEGQRNIAIMVQTTMPSVPRQLTRPTGMADDSSPQWSPDGRQIAFLRVVPDRECRVLVVPATGGAERVVGSCNPNALPGFDWTPDGRGLISDGLGSEHRGLRIFDLASGEVRPIDYQKDPDSLDFSPRYSPDGQWIVFVRNSPLGDFWRIPAAGGPAEQLTRMNAEIRGWSWSPHGRALVYSRRSDSVSRLFRFDLATGEQTDLGIEDGEQPAVARSAPALAYVLRHTRFGIYRFDLGDRAGAGQRLFASSGRDRLPAIAPDGRQLVFTSDRAGPFGLWWADLTDPGSLHLLEGIRPESRHMPAWSKDSKRLLVIGSATGAGSDKSGALYEVVPASGRITKLALPVSDPVQAAYLPGGGDAYSRLLVLADGGGGRLRLSLFDRGDQDWTVLQTLDDVARVQLDEARKRLLFTRVGQGALWQVDLQLDAGSVQPVAMTAGLPLAPWHQAWTTAGDGGIYATRRTASCPALLLRQSAVSAERADEADPASRCLDSGRRAATTGFSVDPRTGSLYISLAEYDGGDIGFATFDPAPGPPSSRE